MASLGRHQISLSPTARWVTKRKDAAKGVNPDRKPTEGNGNPLLYLPRKPWTEMKQKNKDNSVKEASKIESRGLSLGRDDHVQQVTPDHQPATVCNKQVKKGEQKQINIQNEVIRIGTWNVNTMYQAGKLCNIMKEMRRLHVNIMGVSEARWTGSGKLISDSMTIIYSGGEKHEGGVAMILDEEISKCVKAYWSVSSRVLLVKIQAKPFDLNVIQVYAPTGDHTEDEVEEFYEDLNKARKMCKSQEVVMVIGDLNAKVGKGVERQVVGPYGLGVRNDRGERWVEWCRENRFMIANTWFCNHPRRLWTWTSPGGLVRNQIDYIAIDQRFRNSVRQAKGYPGADCGSDHVLVIADIKVKLKRLKKKERKAVYDWQVMDKDREMNNEYRIKIANKFQLIDEVQDLDTKWKLFKEALHSVTEEVVPRGQRKAKQQWMKQDILDLMEERRRVKSTDLTKYQELNKIIKYNCKAAKEEWLNDQCDEIEKARNTARIHEKIKELTGKKRTVSSQCIKNKDGKLLMEEEEIRSRWEEYIEQLYHDDRKLKPSFKNGNEGPKILKEEVAAALKAMKKKKAAGPDDIITEMLATAGEVGIERTTELANIMYESGKLPDELCKSIFIAIPKKAGTTDCEAHRTISLISQFTKVVLRVLLIRARSKFRLQSSEEQYGFKEGCGCRNAIFILRMLSERCIEMQKDLYVCFIDYEKAFDNVRHSELFESLEKLGLDGKDLRLFSEIYWNQSATVRVNGKIGNWIKILKGARQGCVMSPDFFNVYGEEVMETIQDMEGVKIGGRNINNLRFADDAALIADSEVKLQNLMDAVAQASESKGLKINIKKTYCMVITNRKETPRCDIFVRGQQIQQVTAFKYLGSLITSDGRSDKDISARIGMAKAAYSDLKHLLCNKHVTIETRIRVLKCYVWSVMLYGSETWTISRVMQQKLEATEMWFLRRMLKIAWTEKKTNEEVLRMANMKRSLMETIRRRQMDFFGHVMRRNGLENIAITGKVEGRRKRGRPRLKYVNNLNSSLKESVSEIELIRATGDRHRWKSMVANVAIQGT